MKKLTSIKNPLFNTLEKEEMKHVLGGSGTPTATAAAPIMTTSKSTGETTVDGTVPANPNDQTDGGNE